MSCLRITRFFADNAVEVQDRTITWFRAGERGERTLDSLAELKSAVETELEMPRCPIERAVAVLEQLTGKPLFA